MNMKTKWIFNMLNSQQQHNATPDWRERNFFFTAPLPYKGKALFGEGVFHFIMLDLLNSVKLYSPFSY